MIAPRNFTDKLDLYLYVSKRVKQNFHITDEALCADSSYQLPEDWWSVWRCEHLLSDPSGEQHAVLFTNAATCLRAWKEINVAIGRWNFVRWQGATMKQIGICG